MSRLLLGLGLEDDDPEHRLERGAGQDERAFFEQTFEVLEVRARMAASSSGVESSMKVGRADG
jgi:hypothetical protein